MITVQQFAFLIHHHQAIAVTVEGNTQIGGLFNYSLLQLLRVGRATALIDVKAIRFHRHRDDLGTEFGKYPWPSLVCRAMRAIQHDFNAAQTEISRHGIFAELHVSAGGVIDS